MTQQYDKVTIIGAGLLGGSLGLALKRRGLAGHVIGVGRRQPSLDAALSIGAIDEGLTSMTEAAARADLVVICTPAGLVPRYLDELREMGDSATVVTDVASTKGEICAHAGRTWASPRRFVGSHPMAGSEKYGAEHADAGLYEGAVTFVEMGDGLDETARTAVRGLWESVGSRVVEVRPEVHDALVARTSHVPHIVASALPQALGLDNEAVPFIGNGFRDTTRIAEGRPELWRDICLTNAEAVTEGLDEIIALLEQVREAVTKGEGDALAAFFEAGRRARREALGE